MSNSSPQELRERGENNKYYIAIAVALLTFLMYLPSLQNDFVERDDGLYVFDNLHIRSLDMDFFRWAFFDFYAANWHPLTWISHALDYAVWGLDPMGHHLTNNILHAVNAFLVVLLVVRLIEAVLSRQPSSSRVVKWSSSNDSTTQQLNSLSSPFTIHDLPAGRQGSRFTLVAAATTGLLFGLHPLHVESVAWVAERKDVLCALFYLLSIMMYMSYRSHKTYRTYFLTLCFFILALLSKPMAVSLPVVLLILDWYPFQKINSSRTFLSALMEKIPFVALSIASSVITVLAQKSGGAIKSMDAIPLSSRLLVSAHSLTAYLGKMILPINLSPFYPYPENIDFFTLQYLLPVTIIITVTTLSALAVRKQKLPLAVWCYYVLTLVPAIGIVQVGDQSSADRYTYLPSLGPFLVIGLLASWVLKKRRGPRPAALMKYAGIAPAIVILSGLSFLTVHQTAVWKNTYYLWTCVIERESSMVPYAYNNRGVYFGKNGQFDRAIEDFSKAIKIKPTYSEPFNNRGYTYLTLGQDERAFDDINKAIELDNTFAKAYENRAMLYLNRGNKEQAISDFQKACNLRNEKICPSAEDLKRSAMLERQ